jgi:hypothetical protein
VKEVVAVEMVLGTRKRKQTRTFGAESPVAKRLKRNIHGSKCLDALHEELSRKEKIAIVRSWERVLDPSRARDIFRTPVFSIDCRSKQHVTLLVKALAKSRDVIREAERYPIPFLYFAWTLVQPIEGTRRGYIVCRCRCSKCLGRCEIYLYRSNRLFR